MFSVVVGTLSVNTGANVVPPANDVANAFPKWISFRTGGLITGIIGILMQPWRPLADPNGYIFPLLVGDPGGLGSVPRVPILHYCVAAPHDPVLRDPSPPPPPHPHPPRRSS